MKLSDLEALLHKEDPEKRVGEILAKRYKKVSPSRHVDFITAMQMESFDREYTQRAMMQSAHIPSSRG